MEGFNKDIGPNIQRILADKKLRAKDLAEKVGVSPTHLSYVINGKRVPSFELLEYIANALDVTLSDLVKKHSTLAGDPPKVANSDLPPLTAKDERNIQKRIQAILDDLSPDSNSAMSYFDGEEPMSDEDRELLRISLENTMRLAKQMAKQKFTPKKYRK
jgi:transcriptional regulator with XRE-family HTH domain